VKILLIGATGQLGGDILRNNPGHEIVAPGRDILDLQDVRQIENAVRDAGPDVVINCAAFHNVPLCEEQPEKAFFINCYAVGRLAGFCREHGARLVTFSTDYVFGGEKRTPYLEGDAPHPLQIYGITRAAGEYAAIAAAPEHAVIVRTCGLYGRSGAASKGGNFVDKRIADANATNSIEMGSDQVICPTSTDDLSRAVIALIEHGECAPGIYHLVNEGECTWFEFTKAIYDNLGSKVDLRPVDRKGLSGSMRRPLYSALANSKARELGISLRPWKKALEQYLEDRYSLGLAEVSASAMNRS
jgi:dTDP-4-dehydrorhamnose reductase